MMANSKYWGYALTAVGATLFSTKAIFIKLAFRDEVNATLMLAWRMIFAMPFFILVGLWAIAQKRRAGEALPGPRTLGMAALTGFLGYGASSYLDFKGLEYISAQLERLVLFTYPLFVMFLGALIWGHRITRHGIVACIVTYAGLAIVSGIDIHEGGWETLVGVAFVLGCALTFAMNQLMAKGLITAIGSIFFTAVSMMAGGLATVAIHLIADGDFRASSHFLWLALGCAIFATVLPIFCINGGLARISAQGVAMISTLSPLVTISLAVWILNEPFTLYDAIGSALVLAGISYYTWADSRAANAIKASRAGNELARAGGA